MKDYYEILEVTSDASEEVIKAAYKALVKRMHPDNGGTVVPGEKISKISMKHTRCFPTKIKGQLMIMNGKSIRTMQRSNKILEHKQRKKCHTAEMNEKKK